MEGTRDSHTEGNPSEKDKYHMISLIIGISYTAQMNISTENVIIDLENRDMVT